MIIAMIIATMRDATRPLTIALARPITRRGTPSRRRHSSQSGYGYLTALLMAVALLAGTTVFLENALTVSARRREEEMIWRGNQYKRAIRLYFHKTGHYPQDIEALQKGLPQLHFLRQAYKDPMNTADGSWRFIYVNAAGQIIGSTRYASLQQMALIDNPQLMNQSFPQLGVSAASLANSSSSSSAFGQSSQNSAFGSSSFGSSSFGNSSPGGSSFGNSSFGSSSSNNATPGSSPSSNSPSGSSPSGNAPDGSTAAPSTSSTSSTDPSAQSGASSSTSGQSATTAQPGQPLGPDGNPLQNPILLQKPTGPVDGPVLGAFLTGVASTVDQPSRKWFHHAKKYKEWEFIWNPLDDQAAAAQQQNTNTAIPLLGQPAGAGSSAFGQGFGSAFGNGSGNSSPFGGTTPQPQPGPQGNPQAPQ